jgi:ribonuclease T1
MRALATVVVLLMAAAYTWWDSRRESPQTEPPVAATAIEADRSPAPPATTPAERERQSSADLDLSRLAGEEKDEVRRTSALIDAGGPFPYRKDGTTFRNAEKKLPKESGSYYREYTVKTPGSHDRGARRVVAGGRGELYYTNDHYRSFIRIRDFLRH